MKAQWIILIWVTLVSMYAIKPQTSPDQPDITEYRATKGNAFWIFFVPVLILGLRSAACDTSGYISHFNALPPGGSYKTFELFLKHYSKGSGFYRISYYIKLLISRDFHVWFLILCSFSAFCVSRLFRKYSPDFRLSAYLYITSCCYSWLMNGIRQYLAVCILMLFIEFGLQKKVWYDILFVGIVLLAATIHSSSYIMLPIYFLAARQKALTKRTNVVLVISLIIIIALIMTGVYDKFVGESEYSSDVVYFKNNPGTNSLRVALNCIPAILVIINYKKIKEKLTPFVGILINMSFITGGLYIFSMFRMGMLEGRLPAFTEAYNFILYPWLIKNIYKSNKIVYTILIVVYLVFFYYQMNITWDGLNYASDIIPFLN